MKINATQTFLDGTDRYEEGTEYDVTPGAGEYFVRNGWASANDATVAKRLQPQNVTLDIHSGKVGSKADTAEVTRNG